MTNDELTNKNVALKALLGFFEFLVAAFVIVFAAGVGLLSLYLSWWILYLLLSI